MPDDDRLSKILSSAIPPAPPGWSATVSGGVTREMIERAVERSKEYGLDPYRLPAIHPDNYAKALRLLRLPEDHALTEAEYWRAARIEVLTEQANLPEGIVLDPHSDQSGISSNGYAFVFLPDGTRTAWQLSRSEYNLLCPICRAGDDQADCAECHGRGKVDHIPYADRPWDEVVPGLWLGGHACQPKGAPPEGNCYLTDDRRRGGGQWPSAAFDMVVSLHHEHDSRYEPHRSVRHLRHRMRDTDLDPEHHTRLDELATEVSNAVWTGVPVLVRCQAGINRAALVVGLALLKMGWTAEEAISRMREVRSPYVLGNGSYVAYLHERQSALAKEA